MAKSLAEGFNTFLSWLAPSSSERAKAISHKQSVKSCMENNFDCYNFFETGSFGNGTGIRHYSDTDYFAVCKTEKLKANPGVTLREVKEALQRRFSSTEGIEVDRPAVKIPFGTYASESLEVTPCDFVGMIDTPVGNMPQYDIAGYGNEWIRSSPQAHNKFVKQEDERLGGKLKPLIQLVKAWKYYNSVPISSFYLELRVTKYAEDETYIAYDVDLLRIIRLLYDKDLASVRDPMGISGLVPACSTTAKKEEALSKLKTALSRAEKAYDNRESNLDDCFYWWNRFFNDEFPSR